MANEYMMVSSITNVLGQAKDCLVDLGESWIDSKLPENLFKEVPIIKMLMLGRTGVRTVKECHEVRQISQFLLTIDTECTDEARRKRYIKVLNENAKQFEKELEYVTIVVTNYLESEKPQMLGRLYLERLDGGLSWEEFAEYASMLNQLIPGDVMLLKEPHHKRKQSQCRDLLRLTALGLMYEQDSPNFPDGDNDTIKDEETSFTITEFGKKYGEIVL